jgi:hypothetical protein
MKRMIAALLATSLAMLALTASAQAAFSDYGIKSFSASLSSDQAGGHPDFTTSFDLKREASGALFASTRDIAFDLPPGLSGNPNTALKCTAAQLTATDVEDPQGKSCPIDSQVGVSEVTVFNEGAAITFFEPVYNMEPGAGAVARLGFIAQIYPVIIDLQVRSESDFGVTATVRGAGSLIPLLAATTTVWGVPAAASHDSERITPYEAANKGGVPQTPDGKRESGLTPAPFLTNPTRCGAPLEVTMTATSYQLPDQPARASDPLPSMTGCGNLAFEPGLTLTPTSRQAASPTGLGADLEIPQDETANGRATSHLRNATVTLPRGVTIAPGAAEGLAACSAQEAGFGTRDAARCPDAAKIATATIDSPPLERPIEGAVYQRTPVRGDLFGVWLVADELGLHLKLRGEVKADPVSGQLSVAFEGPAGTEGLPQAPVRSFELHFKAGPRAPLAAPQQCGTYLAHYAFTPWSGTRTVEGEAPMTFDQGCETGGFSPRLNAGAANPVAGAFSSFLTTLTREAKEANVSTVDLALPKGVSAKLAGVPLCRGAAVSSGNCPEGSKVGSAIVATGPGPQPLLLPQPGRDLIEVFLSGPYRSAPYSLVVKTPAQAGPFDLGTVVTRAAIRINPRTAQVTVSTDPLPQILEGVPITYRTIHVKVDRPEFTLNPTDCSELAVTAKVTSDNGQLAHPKSRFQVGGCKELPFRPTLSLRLHGKTNRGAHPALTAVLKARKGDANIAYAQVALPRSEFIENAHLNNVCTRHDFAAERCPRGSVYGTATARTPLLSKTLHGKVYLRSSRHVLPDLVIALRGQIDIDAVGRIDTSKEGGLRTTFSTIPDAPISKVALHMRGGHKGLLVNSEGLCAGPHRAQVAFRAHSGKAKTSHPLLRTDCAKAKRASTESNRNHTDGRE